MFWTKVLRGFLYFISVIAVISIFVSTVYLFSESENVLGVLLFFLGATLGLLLFFSLIGSYIELAENVCKITEQNEMTNKYLESISKNLYSVTDISIKEFTKKESDI